MIDFDENGYLIPYKTILVDYEVFVSNFVTNEHRLAIFEEYQFFLEKLKALVGDSFFQWVNGSFTSRHPNPADVDVVSFIHADRFQTIENDLRILKRGFKFVDAYFVREFPKEHPNRMFTDFDATEWKFLFSTDRRRKNKGFIQLNF